MKSQIEAWKSGDKMLYISKNFILLILTKCHVFPYFIFLQFFSAGSFTFIVLSLWNVCCAEILITISVSKNIIQENPFAAWKILNY